MNGCNTDIFFCNYFHLQSVRFEFTGQILPTCAVLQDASAPAQFERASSGDKDQGEETVLFSNDHPEVCSLGRSISSKS